MSSVQQFERRHGVRLIRKRDSRLMSLIGRFSRRFRNSFWTTYRVPFGRPTITYPAHVPNPLLRPGILAHELVHVEQFRPWYGPILVVLLVTVFPLPVLFSGRWFVERPAYLEDIRAGRRTINNAVRILWSGYGWPWPRFLMRRWFLKRTGGHVRSRNSHR